MSKPKIAITGATGSLGGRIAQKLADREVPLRLIVRDASRAPELPGAEVATATYLDQPAMLKALKGIETVFFVSGFEAKDRLEQHKSAVDAFVRAGVKRVVYTSFLNAAPDSTFTFARHHYHTEQYLEDAGLRFVALRDSLYMDLLPHFVDDGVILGPAGEGKFAPVSRDDIADVAVALLLDEEHPTARYDLTGPELLTMSEVAEQLSEAGESPVRFVNETLEEAYASRAHFGAPDFEVEGWVTSYYAINVGEMEVVSDTVQRIAGHPPISFERFLDSGNR
jgi:NAD(P)H dehydrogenase (quinone)